MSEVTFKSDMDVTLIQHMGSDEMIARSARVSTGQDEMDQGKIAGLINYLVRERHTSTLEHCVATFRVEAPIFVAREFMRHRTFSYNEISGRYAKLPPVFYSPGEERPLINEGSGAHPNLVPGSQWLHKSTSGEHVQLAFLAWDSYSSMIDDGIANEVARNVLPVGIYTKFYVTGNLNNWFKFLWLRNGENGHPQYEIVEVAKKVESQLAELYPLAYEAWRKTLA